MDLKFFLNQLKKTGYFCDLQNTIKDYFIRRKILKS